MTERMRKFKVQSQSDVRYAEETIIIEKELIELLEFNLIDFIRQNSIKDEESLFVVKDTIDSLEEFYQYKDKDINKVKCNLIDWFNYDVEDYEEPITNSEIIINLVVDLKALENCNSYEEYFYDEIVKRYIEQMKVMEDQGVDFDKARDSICYLIEREILQNLKENI